MGVYLIQGFFFQEQTYLGIGRDNMGEDRVMINKGVMHQYMFSGIIFPDERNALGGHAGLMMDHFGESELSNVVLLLPEEIKFIKRYNGRDDLIDYKFVKEGDIWVGEYSGKEVKLGSAKCLITEVPEDFVVPPPLKKKS